MIITDRILYLQLQKTGSTYIGELLRRGLGGQAVGKHEPLDLRQLSLLDNREVIGSIRHPFDWYVSLWGYTCGHRGELYDRTAGSALRHCASITFRYREPEFRGLWSELSKDRRYWTSLYRDVNDIEAFAEWFDRLHSPAGRSLWRGGLLGIPLDLEAGLYTHWFRRCYTPRQSRGRRVASGQSRSHRRTPVVSRLVRLESVRGDLGQALEAAGYEHHQIDAVLAASDKVGRNESDRLETKAYVGHDLASTISRLDRQIFEVGGYHPC